MPAARLGEVRTMGSPPTGPPIFNTEDTVRGGSHDPARAPRPATRDQQPNAAFPGVHTGRPDCIVQALPAGSPTASSDGRHRTVPGLPPGHSHHEAPQRTVRNVHRADRPVRQEAVSADAPVGVADGPGHPRSGHSQDTRTSPGHRTATNIDHRRPETSAYNTRSQRRSSPGPGVRRTSRPVRRVVSRTGRLTRGNRPIMAAQAVPRPSALVWDPSNRSSIARRTRCSLDGMRWV
jgi:hypothetical protein